MKEMIMVVHDLISNDRRSVDKMAGLNQNKHKTSFIVIVHIQSVNRRGWGHSRCLCDRDKTGRPVPCRVYTASFGLS